MATTKKSAVKAVAKEVPAVGAKPAATPAALAAKPAGPRVVAAAKKVVAKAATPVAPKAPSKSKAKTNGAAVDPGQRANYIEVAAFYIAERRGFAPGNQEQDYLDAASEIDSLIAAGHFGK